MQESLSTYTSRVGAAAENRVVPIAPAAIPTGGCR